MSPGQGQQLGTPLHGAIPFLAELRVLQPHHFVLNLHLLLSWLEHAQGSVFSSAQQGSASHPALRSL